MMKKFVLIRYILMLWLLCGACHTAAFASSYNRSTSVHSPYMGESEGASSQGWGYQPLQTLSSTSGYTPSYGGTTTRGGTYSASSLHPSLASRPTFHFQSTSVLINSFNAEQMQMMSSNDIMRDSWGDPDDDEDMPIGTTPVTPVGEPLILILFAFAFFGFKYYRRRNA